MEPDAVNAIGRSGELDNEQQNNNKVYILRKENRKKTESLISQLSREDIFFNASNKTILTKTTEVQQCREFSKSERIACNFVTKVVRV